MRKPVSQDIYNEKDFPVSAMRLAILEGMGVDVEELKQKPIIAVANSHTELNPGHTHLGILAQRVKDGIHAAGGMPFEFNVPAPCDAVAVGNIGMRFVLPQRELIADIIETHVRSMRFDGVVMIASCDKIIPGMLMACARLDLPAIFLTGGPNAMKIRHKPEWNGSIRMKDYDDMEAKMACVTCATCGACEFMGTANTFQCLTEALGISLPGSASIPAVHAEKQLVAGKVGKRIVEMVSQTLTSGKILTPEAIENAVMTDMAIGGSTNATLHLPALAHELGVDLPLAAFNTFNRKVPTICRVAPNGPHGIQDLYRAGGVPAVMKRIADDLHLDALTVSGQTIGEVVGESTILDSRVIPDRHECHYPEGGTVALFGNLAPEGAVVKQSAVEPGMLTFCGPARIFESEADCLTAIREKTLREGEVIVIRNEGPKGGPGMPETVAVTVALGMSGLKKYALITDGRFSGFSAGPVIGHVSPEASVGGPIAAVRDGDEIRIEIENRKLEVALSDEEITTRLESWKPVRRDIPPGYMHRYVKYVTSAARGAVLE